MQAVSFRNKDGTRTVKVIGAYLDGFVGEKHDGQGLVIPCGKCIGCRLERSRQWAMRCMHEASLYEDNCMVTLTYDPAFMPSDCGLHLEHFQLFFKRLRKKFGNGIRYFHCGEYGDLGRPHYHAIIFNLDFPHKKKLKDEDGMVTWTSDMLSEIWGKGYCTISAVTFDSAAYVARYCLAKFTGPEADEHYRYVCDQTGKVYRRASEYATMSRRPGIGRDWFVKFKSDCYPSDFLIVKGHRVKPPKYYDKLFEKEDKIGFENVKDQRELKQEKKGDETLSRLGVRERCKVSQLKSKKRCV